MNKCNLGTDRTLLFWCPGCNEPHGIRVEGATGVGPIWGWNGSLDAPSITPSINVRQTLYGPERLTFGNYDGPMPTEKNDGVCHSFVTDGRIQFCGDCTHKLAGQTVELPDWDTAHNQD